MNAPNSKEAKKTNEETFPRIKVAKNNTKFWNAVRTLANPEYEFGYGGGYLSWLMRQQQEMLRKRATELLSREGISLNQ